MKVLRGKKFRRILQFYRLHFGFHRPYKIVCDASFLQTAKEQKLHVKDQLTALLAERKSPSAAQPHHNAYYSSSSSSSSGGGADGVQIVVSSCIHAHLATLGNAFGGAAFIAKQFPSLRCRHGANAWKGKGKAKNDVTNQSQDMRLSASVDNVKNTKALPSSASASATAASSSASSSSSSSSSSLSSSPDVLSDFDCIRCLVSQGNPDGLFVATMNPELQKFVRSLPGVPLIFIHGTAPILDKPSRASEAAANAQATAATSGALSKMERAAVHVSKELLRTPATTTALPGFSVEQLWTDAVDKMQREEKEPKNQTRKRKAKAPNPLSVKKKKIDHTTNRRSAQPASLSAQSQSQSTQSSTSFGKNSESDSSSPTTSLGWFSSTESSHSHQTEKHSACERSVESMSIEEAAVPVSLAGEDGKKLKAGSVAVSDSQENVKEKKKRKRFRVRRKHDSAESTANIEAEHQQHSEDIG